SKLSPSQVAPLVHRRKQGKTDSIGACFTPARGKLHHLQNGDEFKTLVQAALKTYELKKGPPAKIPYIPGSAFWIHREVIEQVGVMDERLGTYWDDVDYSARILEKGLPLLYQAESEVVHQVGKTTYKLALYTTYFFQRNRRVISRRHVGRSWPLRVQLWWTLQTSAATVAARFLLNRDFKRLSLFSKALKDADRFK
ncbi:MAG: glycosyltransferase family 2 protein, partial [Bdellovibrio sp.]